MPRYCVEVSYKGSRYAGFQVQDNANTIQAEVEKALGIFFRSTFELTGSSRTDTGVHALQNFFHFDQVELLSAELLKEAPYHINAILPDDIVLHSISAKSDNFHCRFDALSREYEYFVYRKKDPFMEDRGYYFPYSLDLESLQAAANEVMKHTYFETFSKKRNQVKTFECQIFTSEWVMADQNYIYRVKGSRFLRGMVRGLVGTMLRVGTGKLSQSEFREIIKAGDQSKADFSVPAQGLFLVRVNY